MAKIKNDRSLTIERLRQLLCYNPINGLFTWRVTVSPTAFAGSLAGAVRKHGYRMIRIDGGQYRAARLAWFYCYGEWPTGLLDHINRIRNDDCLCNLREVTHSQNSTNRTTLSATGIKGVHRASYRERYQAMIMHNGKRVHLGVFKTLEEAAAVRKAAALRLHGDFAYEAR